MGLIQAAVGAIGGTLADQWKDFFTVPDGLAPTAALFAAVKQEQNAGRGSNTKGSDNIITNGSRIVVPEGYGLVLLEQGAITGFVAEAGAYEWRSDDPNSQSIFAGDGIVSPLIKQSWERFKFGGQPGAQQRAYFVTLKELPNNRFGTQSEIYWDDACVAGKIDLQARRSHFPSLSSFTPPRTARKPRYDSGAPPNPTLTLARAVRAPTTPAHGRAAAPGGGRISQPLR